MGRLDVLIDSTSGRHDLFFVFKSEAAGSVFAVGDIVFQHRNALADGASIQLLFKKLEVVLNAGDAEKLQPFLTADFQSFDKKEPTVLKKTAMKISISELELAGEWAWLSSFSSETESFLAICRRVKPGDWRLARVMAR